MSVDPRDFRMVHLRSDRPKAPNGWPLDRWLKFQASLPVLGYRQTGREATRFGDLVVIEQDMGDHWRVLWYGPDRKHALSFHKGQITTPESRRDVALKEAREHYAAHEIAVSMVG